MLKIEQFWKITQGGAIRVTFMKEVYFLNITVVDYFWSIYFFIVEYNQLINKYLYYNSVED